MIVKVAVVVFVITFGAHMVHPGNWVPFAPSGFTGVMSGAAIVFFAYIGFDAVSTTAEETKNPQRDLPIGMMASLMDVLYVSMSGVLTGIKKYTAFVDDAAPVATVFANYRWYQRAKSSLPAERFCELARYLDLWRITPLFLAGSADDTGAFGAHQIVQGELSHAKSLLSKASVFIGNDSGPAHIAAAFGVPSVVLFGNSNPAVWIILLHGFTKKTRKSPQKDLDIALKRLAHFLSEKGGK